jgi:Glucosidase II beta subunit-like protein/Glucosidase II beta subunit-like
LKLTLSRVDDGICDCCDGADEQHATTVSCPDNCEEMLRAEREARAKLEHDFAKGYATRQSELEKFRALREGKLQEVQGLETKLNNEILPSIESLQTQIRDLKQDYVKSRVSTMKEGVIGSSVGQQLLAPLNKAELEQFIIHACQVAGEILDEDSTTCVPLRMAGLDMALTWSDDNFDKIDEMKGEVEMTPDMIQLIFDNAVKGGALKWNTSSDNKKKNRRRLDEVYGDDDYMGDYYDRYEDDNDDMVDEPPHGDKEKSRDDPEAERKEKEIINEISASVFSETRNSFVARAKVVTEEISKILDAPSDEVEDGANSESEESKHTSSSTKFDPAAFTMVRNELRNKEAAIQKGSHWAASAKLLFSFSNQSENNLLRLAIGTVYYGQLSALHVWQILQAVLPEYSSPAELNDTCGSPWARSCPPKMIERNGAAYPPSILVDAAAAFCDSEAAKSNSEDTQSICAAQEQSAEPRDVSIPDNVPDGYYGYSSPIKRADDDPLSVQLFVPIDSLAIPTDELKTLEDNKRGAENEKRTLERSIDDIWKDIGGKDGDQMGENGELHSMADQCYSVLAGKYTYEVCVFGRASQKEGKGGGTNLGNWRGIERDEESGDRVMKWDGGAKCWNGPQRSATVFVTCGAEHKVLSADEPDTCRYVFEMESPIGCDDDYKAKMGL